MRAAVRGADSECTIEHASQEDESVTCIAGLIAPFRPDEGVAGVSSPGNGGHDGTHHHGRKPDAYA